MRWLDGITDSMDMKVSGRQWRTEEPGMLQSMDPYPELVGPPPSVSW